MLDDNEISFILTKELESQNHTKHIDVMNYHFCRWVKDEEFEIE